VRCDCNSLPVLLKEGMWYIRINSPRLKSSCSNLAITVKVKDGFPTRDYHVLKPETCPGRIPPNLEKHASGLWIVLIGPRPKARVLVLGFRLCQTSDVVGSWFIHHSGDTHASQIWLNTTLICRWIIPIWANNHPNMTSIWIDEMGDTVPTHPPFRTIQGEPCLPIF
jgi:hypothetical protein